MSALLRYAAPYAVAALLVLVPRPAQSLEAIGLPRLRSTNPAIALVIAEATKRSATFRKLLEDLASTDGLVYVETGRCGHGVRACLKHSLAGGGPFRVLQILIEPHDVANRRGLADLVGTIAHEVQHALEILTDPRVIDDASVYMFYARTVPTSKTAFETRGAILTGYRVSSEMSGR